MPVDDQYPKYKRAEFRKGISGFPGWEGQERDGDAASIAPNRPRLVVNGTFRGDQIISRGGQSRVNEDPFDLENVRSLFDHQIDHPVKLYMIMAGCLGPSGPLGFGGISYVVFDQEADPVFQRACYYPGSVSGGNLVKFDDRIFISVDNVLKKLNFVSTPYGTEQFTIVSEFQDREIYTFADMITALATFDNKIFCGIADGATSKMYTFDGLTIVDDTGGNFSAAPTGFGTYRDFLILGYGAAANKISYRRAGASGAAVWTDVAGATEGLIDKGVEYKDKFYWVGVGDDVWVYDGATIASARNIAGATMGGVVVANGNLYVSYTIAGAGALALFDGSTWTNLHKSFSGQLTTATKIEWFRNCLFVGGETAIGGHDILQSPTTDTGGVWTSMPSGLVYTLLSKMIRVD